MLIQRIAQALVLILYAVIPVAALVLVPRSGRNIALVAFDVAVATVPMVLLAAITWRLVWPRWKLVAKVLIHPFIYALLSLYIGHWSILLAWLHQGLFGLGGHIWFSRKHGFTWYAVEDPERYVILSKATVAALADRQPGSR
jgi:hypothetical protein